MFASLSPLILSLSLCFDYKKYDKVPFPLAPSSPTHPKHFPLPLNDDIAVTSPSDGILYKQKPSTLEMKNPLPLNDDIAVGLSK